MLFDFKKGVVMEDCWVYGVNNFYMVGGLVFLIGGYVNFMLMIIVLFLWFGDYFCEVFFKFYNW